MPDQDFNIKVVTTADTTGLRQTREEIDKVRQAAEKTRQDAGAAKLFAAIPPSGAVPASGEIGAGASAGLTGTSVGIGTIVTLLTVAISKWREFNHELDVAVEKMIQSEEKMRALGESILEMQDRSISARRIGIEPLEQSFERLTHEIAVLKTEQSLLDLPRQGEEWKKINQQIGFNEGLLNRVTSSLKQQAAEAEKAAKARDKATEKRLSDERDFTGKALESSSAQTKAILENEERARRARAAGDDKSADQFQKTADQLKKSATPGQIDEYEQLRNALLGGEARPGRKAGIGESQEAVDEIERNRIQFDKIRQDEANNPDLQETNKYIKQAGGKPITQAQAQAIDLKQAIEDLGAKFDRYWG